MKKVSTAMFAVALSAISIPAFSGDLTQVASRQSRVWKDDWDILNARAAFVISEMNNVPENPPKICEVMSRITFPKQPGISPHHEILIGNIVLDKAMRHSSEPRQIQVIGFRQHAAVTWHTRYMLWRGELNDNVTLFKNSDKPNFLFVFFQTSNSRTGGGLEAICWDLEKHKTESLFSVYGEQESSDSSYSVRRQNGATSIVIYGLRPPVSRLQKESRSLAESIGVPVRLVHDAPRW